MSASSQNSSITNLEIYPPKALATELIRCFDADSSPDHFSFFGGCTFGIGSVFCTGGSPRSLVCTGLDGLWRGGCDLLSVIGSTPGSDFGNIVSSATRLWS